MADLSTYGDVVHTVYGMIQDSATNRRLATTDQIDIWANSCLAEMAEHSEYITATMETTLTTGQGASISVTDGNGVMGLVRVEIDDEFIPPTNTRALYSGSRTWQEQTGEPRFYYTDSMRGYTADGLKFGVWPLAGGSYDLRVVYTVVADELSYANSTDKVMLPLWAVPGLVWGILSKFYESESRMQNFDTARFYRMLFVDTMTRLRVRSYSALNRRKAYGEGRTRMSRDDFRQLMPADGFPYP